VDAGPWGTTRTALRPRAMRQHARLRWPTLLGAGGGNIAPRCPWRGRWCDNLRQRPHKRLIHGGNWMMMGCYHSVVSHRGLSHAHSNANSLHSPRALMRCGPERSCGGPSVESLRRRERFVASQRSLRTHSRGPSGLRRCCTETSGCYHLAGRPHSDNLSKQRRVISLRTAYTPRCP
jgi:hypothetical protein